MILLGFQAILGKMPAMAGAKPETVADRAKRLRQALGLHSQQAMAAYLGVSFNRWNNVERGLPLGHELAVLLCQRLPGMTLDWLYFGETGGLSLELARRLGEAPQPSDEPPTTLKRSRRGG
jgi:DNA-binding XRE family transcriptional regulator